MEGYIALAASKVNGEIYGFRSLKRKLEGKGYVFRSDSDCEILLPLYAEYGLGMFRMLDAEFALVLYDAREVAAYIGSDHREIYMTREDVFCALEQVIAALGTYATARASIFCAALSRRGAGCRTIS